MQYKISTEADFSKFYEALNDDKKWAYFWMLCAHLVAFSDPCPSARAEVQFKMIEWRAMMEIALTPSTKIVWAYAKALDEIYTMSVSVQPADEAKAGNVVSMADYRNQLN